MDAQQILADNIQFLLTFVLLQLFLDIPLCENRFAKEDEIL